MYLNDSELKEARERRMLEIKSYDTLREIVIYSIFLSLLVAFTYTNVGNSTYAYHKNLLNTFNPSDVYDTKGFWDWSRNTLATNLRATVWYNGKQPYGLAGFLNDKTSRMVGYAVLRQLRVQKESCKIPNSLKNVTNFCNSDLNMINEEKQSYGLNWMEYNETVFEEVGMSRIYNSFIYRNSDSLQGLPYWGSFNLYNGGGYVYELRGKLNHLVGNLTFLQQNNWIDRQTRAVFAEFSIYNPNINLFMVSTILFEFLPSGNILASARFDPLNLFSEYDSYVGMRIAFGVLYLVFVFYFMITQTISIYKLGVKKYFCTFWNILDWTIYILAWASFSIYLYRFYSAQKVLDFFKNTSGYGYIKLQNVNEWNQILTYLLGISCALATIKFLRLFRFNRKIYSLIFTLKYTFKELFWFSIIFLVIYMAFVQVLYLMLYERVLGYQSFIKAMATSFQIMLGKFSADSLQNDGRFLAILFFSMYNVFIVMMMLNMFISILTDGFDAVRKESKQKSNDLEILDFFLHRFKDMVGYNKKEKVEAQNLKSHNDYHDYTNTLTVKVNDLIFKVIENANENNVLGTIPDEENEASNNVDLNDAVVKKTKVESNIIKRKEFHKKNTVFDQNGNPDLTRKND
jgi:polycystin 1L2